MIFGKFAHPHVVRVIPGPNTGPDGDTIIDSNGQAWRRASEYSSTPATGVTRGVLWPDGTIRPDYWR
jgi:hypothetical protein